MDKKKKTEQKAKSKAKVTKKKVVKKPIVKKKRIRNRSANTDPDKLTVQQRAFVNFYLKPKEKGGDNITKAYYHAYPKTKTDTVAGSSGHKLLKLPKIVKIVDDARRQAVEETGMTAKETLLGIVAMAQSDLADYMEWKEVKLKKQTEHGEEENKDENKPDNKEEKGINDEFTADDATHLIVKFKDSSQLTKKQTRLIKKMRINKDGSVSFELESKAKAYDMLARYHGLLDSDAGNDNLSPHMMIVNFMEQLKDGKDEE